MAANPTPSYQHPTSALFEGSLALTFDLVRADQLFTVHLCLKTKLRPEVFLMWRYSVRDREARVAALKITKP